MVFQAFYGILCFLKIPTQMCTEKSRHLNDRKAHRLLIEIGWLFLIIDNCAIFLHHKALTAYLKKKHKWLQQNQKESFVWPVKVKRILAISDG